MSAVTRIIRETINLIKTRFNDRMIFIRLNKEKFLEDEFNDFFIERRISFESFASDSSKQNDHFEKKKKVLVMKTRAMRIDVEFSTYL
jgi:hypothetical protein